MMFTKDDTTLSKENDAAQRTRPVKADAQSVWINRILRDSPNLPKDTDLLIKSIIVYVRNCISDASPQPKLESETPMYAKYTFFEHTEVRNAVPNGYIFPGSAANPHRNAATM